MESVASPPSKEDLKRLSHAYREGFCTGSIYSFGVVAVCFGGAKYFYKNFEKISTFIKIGLGAFIVGSSALVKGNAEITSFKKKNPSINLNSISGTQELLSFLSDYRYPLIGFTWLSGLCGSIYRSYTYPDITTQQRLFHARVHAQALTIAAILLTGILVNVAPPSKKEDLNDEMFLRRIAYEDKDV